MAADCAPEPNIEVVFLDLYRFNRVLGLDDAVVFFDHDFLSVSQKVGTELNRAEVPFNHQFSDFSGDCQLRVRADAVHNDRRIRRVHLCQLTECTVVDVLIDDLSTRHWLDHESNLSVIKCVAILGG